MEKYLCILAALNLCVLKIKFSYFQMTIVHRDQEITDAVALEVPPAAHLVALRFPGRRGEADWEGLHDF